MSDYIKVNLPGGAVVEGTASEVAKVLKALGVKGTAQIYFSKSKGPMAIAAMNSVHIRNAAAKEYAAWVQNILRASVTPKVFLSLMQSGPDTALMQGFVLELTKRKHQAWG